MPPAGGYTTALPVVAVATGAAPRALPSNRVGILGTPKHKKVERADVLGILNICPDIS